MAIAERCTINITKHTSLYVGNHRDETRDEKNWTTEVENPTFNTENLRALEIERLQLVRF